MKTYQFDRSRWYVGAEDVNGMNDGFGAFDAHEDCRVGLSSKGKGGSR